MTALRNRHLFLIDAVLLPAVAVLAFAVRLDVAQLSRVRTTMIVFIGVLVPLKLVVFYYAGLYSRLWRYASVDELVRIIAATFGGELIGAALFLAVVVPFQGITTFPRSVLIIDALLTVLAVGGPRFAIRFLYRGAAHGRGPGGRGEATKVLVVGAGDAGAMIVKEMRERPGLGFRPVAYVDDDPSKHGIRIHGTPVRGDRHAIPSLVAQHGIDEVIIAMPSAPGRAVRDVVRICEGAGVRAKIVPAIADILFGRVSLKDVRNVQIEDLLRREPVRTDMSEVERMIRGTRVLVTGAGGSIGSELCRQIARFGPSRLVLLGHGENSLFSIHAELEFSVPDVVISTRIADTRDEARLRAVFAEHAPLVVFHAAAHKHVPLMEENAQEAVTNNVLGTWNVLRVSEEFGVKRFVYISTDKAVKPSSVMGATKRVGELLVREAARRLHLPYVSVRFGNVLGSRGSVVPFFQAQIARGGPVTVTHPEVRRYFMTIPEAVQLVLQAAALGEGGEVILLEMGEPIRIVDLARDLIELSGLEVGKDIEITFTGLRPGEKLTEELFVDAEQYVHTKHEKLFALRNGDDGLPSGPALEAEIQTLLDVSRNGDDIVVRRALKRLVPDYAWEGPDAPAGTA